MQIISQSPVAILTAYKDYSGSVVYTVMYGLQVNTFSYFEDALKEYNNALLHSFECGDLVG